MRVDVVCLRPESDFSRVGVSAPGSLRVAYRAPDAADVPVLVKEARALVIPAVGPKLAAELFEDTSLELIQVTGAGVDRIDPAVCRRRGIAVANVPGGSNSAVAEYVVASAILLARRLKLADAEIRSGNFGRVRAKLIADNLRGLEGLLVGVVGFGTIGRAVAQLFRQMGCDICFYDRVAVPAADSGALGATSVPFAQLVEQADIVTLHVPLLPGTRHLIGRSELARMKAGAVLVQASRGDVVDEAALAESLTSGHLGGAAVDVYSSEPPAAENPLLALQGEAAQRVLFTPHIAGVTQQSAAFLFRSAWDNVERVLVHGRAPLNAVAWN